MGRLTPSFRTVYSEVLDDLRKEMRNCFVDVTHKDAFDLLFTLAGWLSLQGRMATLSTNSSHRGHAVQAHVALVTEYNAAQASSQAICDVVHSVRFTILLKKS